MLREDHTIAANDAARLDDIETSAAADLGAELRDASPEVRAVAVLRSRRLPDPSIMRDAWRSLPGSLQDRIGTAAITHSFYSRESQENPCGLTLEAGRWAGEIETQALNEVETIAVAALPELYGTDDAAPAWTLSDTPLSFPDPYASPRTPTAMPPKVRADGPPPAAEPATVIEFPERDDAEPPRSHEEAKPSSTPTAREFVRSNKLGKTRKNSRSDSPLPKGRRKFVRSKELRRNEQNRMT